MGDSLKGVAIAKGDGFRGRSCAVAGHLETGRGAEGGGGSEGKDGQHLQHTHAHTISIPVYLTANHLNLPQLTYSRSL